MDVWILASLGALTTGVFSWFSARTPFFGWIALVPLGLVFVRVEPPLVVAWAGALAGALSSAESVSRPEFRALIPLTVIPSAAAAALAAFASAVVVARWGPSGLIIGLPLFAVLTYLPLRLLGAPRWVANPLACSQEPWLSVMHTARLGGDLTVNVILGLASCAVVLLVTSSVALAIVPALMSLLGLALGVGLFRSAVARLEGLESIRIATVVVDGPPPPGRLSGLWPMQSEAYRDVDATARRYAPFVEEAAERRAKLVVLPEVCVRVDSVTRERWLAVVAGWARDLDVIIVSPFFDESVPVNALVVVGPSGAIGEYEKQHPARGLEPAPRKKTPPGPWEITIGEHRLPLSTVICVDLDYDDFHVIVRRAGGLLVAPSNDWSDGFADLHHRTAVWAAVATGVTTIRAAGHGISAVFDGAGRVLAQASSERGPAVLVADAPISVPR